MSNEPGPEHRKMVHHGPMHGERTARHQMSGMDSNARNPKPNGLHAIFSAMEVVRGSGPRLRVEFMVDGFTNALEFTVTEAREVAGAFADFVVAWEDHET